MDKEHYKSDFSEMKECKNQYDNYCSYCKEEQCEKGYKKKCKLYKECELKKKENCILKIALIGLTILVILFSLLFCFVCNNNLGEISGTIIPYSSGNASELVIASNEQGNPFQVALISFGGSAIVSPKIGQNTRFLDLSVLNSPWDASFVVPRDGQITSFYATYTTTLEVDFSNSNSRIMAKLFKANTTSGLYNEIVETELQVSPLLNGTIGKNNIYTTNIENISVDINAGDKILLAFYLVTENPRADIQIARGFASGGLNIK